MCAGEILLQIIKYPHPALRYESVPVRTIDAELQARVRQMFELMYEHHGVGLAANQVGLPFRLFVLNTTADPDQADQERVFINPEIIKRHSSTYEEEGCLSFPELYGEVPRAKRIRVRAYDLSGQEIELDAEDLLGRAIQHETDHLSGKLFIDYFTPELKKRADKIIRELETQFRAEQTAGAVPPDEEIIEKLRQISATGA